MKAKVTVDSYIDNHPKWQKELSVLRNILLKTELVETVKWNMPTYMIKGKNVISLNGFKNHFCLWFHQGVFLSDPHNLMFNAQEGKTKAMRHLRFHNLKDIDKKIVAAYVKEAIDNQKAGKEIKNIKSKVTQPIMPTELATLLDKEKDLMKQFNLLSEAKQRDYKNYIISAKRQSTKEKRIDIITPLIKAGKGINDHWK